ncbi:hypothetical protein [Salmonella enterica]|uniref:hypothetical protein n=1 Tax=Salmonella enterica TaxID=28901 RepID=UPI001E59736D|nr:hypothetical protein [Salmonella enterica]
MTPSVAFFSYYFFFFSSLVGSEMCIRDRRRAILRGVAQQRAREARMRAAQAQQEAA